MQPLVARTSSTTSTQSHTVSKIIPRLARKSLTLSQTSEPTISSVPDQSPPHAELEVSSNHENETERVPQPKWVPPSLDVKGEGSRAKRAAVKLLNRVATKDRPRLDPKQHNNLKSEAPKTGNRAGLIRRFMGGRKRGTNDKASLKKEFTDNLKSQSTKASPCKDLDSPVVGEMLDSEVEGGAENLDVAGMDPPVCTEDGSSIEFQASPFSTGEAGESPRQANPFSQTVTNITGFTPQRGSSRVSNVKASSEGWSEQTPPDSSSRANSARRGVYMKVKAHHLDLVGEKGSRVPNITVKEILLEVECLMSVDLEYSESKGWEFRGGVVFEIIDAKKQVVGNSLPLPLGLVKTVLNMLLPKVRTSRIVFCVMRNMYVFIAFIGISEA